MFEHARDSVFCSHHLSRVLLGMVSREWSQDTLDNDGKKALHIFIYSNEIGILSPRRACFAREHETCRRR